MANLTLGEIRKIYKEATGLLYQDHAFFGTPKYAGRRAVELACAKQRIAELETFVRQVVFATDNHETIKGQFVFAAISETAHALLEDGE